MNVVMFSKCQLVCVFSSRLKAGSFYCVCVKVNLNADDAVLDPHEHTENLTV